MRAMILAAGLGTRLGSMTANTPKCLIEAGGKTMLEHVVARLKKAAVREVIINLHYLPDQIIDYVKLKNNFGIGVDFSHEPEILGTGGGLRKVKDFFSGPGSFLVVNCDIYCELDLALLLKRQNESRALGTLAVANREEKTYLLFDSQMRLVNWSKAADLATGMRGGETARSFCGIQALNPEIFFFLDQEPATSFSIIDTYVKAAKAGKTLAAYDIGATFWIDMGTPEKLSQLSGHLNKAA